ncbi:MAG: substrate-binding domain-containing protein [Spirochaetales bacterium]|nr:substrate-binding domain-containing protein [Spirochaetales bacterium]
MRRDCIGSIIPLSLLGKMALVLILGGSILFSCSREKSEAGEEEQRVLIGFSAATETFLLERWDRDIQIFLSSARALGAEVILQKAEGDAMGQIPQIEYLIDEGVDVLVVIPHDMKLLAGILRKAEDRGIPVLAYDRPIMGVPISGYVSFDNREVGRLLSRALMREVPGGNYLIVNGSVRDNNSYEVNRGVYEVLQPSLDSGEITVMEEIWLDEWSSDEAFEKISRVMNENRDIQAISAANDQIADAAIRVLSERQLAGEVAVVGQDADLLSCQRVVEGSQLMTVYKPISRLAERAATLALAFARGERPEPDQTLDNGSETPIPYYVETPVPVFRETMDETVIKDGFHSKDEVYRSY